MAYDPWARASTLYGDAGEVWDFDGSDWTGPTPAGPGPRAQGAVAFDPGRRALALFGGAWPGGDLGDLWVLDRHAASSVFAAHLAVFTIDSASLSAGTVRYAGAATGDGGAGGAAQGVELLAYDWQSRAWQTLGTSSVPDPEAGVIEAQLPAPAGRFLGGGRVALLAVPTSPSSPPGGSVASAVATDRVELRATYVVP